MARHDMAGPEKFLQKFPLSFLASPGSGQLVFLPLLVPLCLVAPLLSSRLSSSAINKRAPAARLGAEASRHHRVVCNSAKQSTHNTSRAKQFNREQEQPAAATAKPSQVHHQAVCVPLDPTPINPVQCPEEGAMAAARIAACTASSRTASAFAFALADEPAPPETLGVVRRQRQLLRRAAALCLDPIAEETDGAVDSAASEVPSFGGRSRSRSTTSALPARP